ncbi:MAG: sodium/solute symporter [Sedimentisphaerales bacterium]|nr:sodium/solute symporter [Sedimentisphaerales bacterium]
MHLSYLDYFVFLAYMLIVILIGFAVARREKKTSLDYFLAGDNLPWFAIGFSLVASSISTEQFVGEVGYAYRYGLAVSNWEWGVFAALTIMLVFFVPLYISRRISTMPEYLEYRFGPLARILFGVITILSYVFINLAGVIYSGALALHTIFGINIWLAACLLAAVAGAYTIAGGLASVVWTDVFQAVLLLGGGLLVFFLGVDRVGFEAIRGTGDRAHLILPADHPSLPWTGMVVLFLSTNLWYYATNQYINQRVLGARDQWHARAGILFAAFLGIFLTLAVCFPGLIAYKLFPGLENPDQAYPKVVSELIGPLGYGIRGLVFAGLIGAIMSTIDSLVNSCSTIITIDFYKRFFKKDASQASMITFGRISSTILLAISLLWTPVVASWDSIFSYFQECWFFMAVPIVVVFVSAILWKRANSMAANATLILSIAFLGLPYLLRRADVEINAFNLAGILLVPVIAFHVIIAYLSKAPNLDKVRFWLWTPEMVKLPVADRKSKWYRSLLLWWAVLLAVFIVIYIIFW